MSFVKSTVSLSDTKQFSKLIINYINGDESLRKFYTYTPHITSFQQAIEDKSKEGINRKVLVEALHKQYLQSGIKDKSSTINLLLSEKTFTVCTGHQLCLFTGPLYFIYKIITTINLAEELKKTYPTYEFVPVYWMASEDHDFEEISSINIFNKQITWNLPSAKGGVGRLSTESLAPLLDELKLILGDTPNATELIALFTNAYLGQKNLADATRVLVHHLFEAYPLIVLDADDANLKNEFLHIMKDDIEHQTNFSLVNQSIEALKKEGFSAQVNPREINVFRMSNDNRTRIESSTEENLNLRDEEYSPNVVLRPLYQQKILPNLAYVGGPGEIAYWLEYKAMFDHHRILFPVLIPRNFALMLEEKPMNQFYKLGFETKDLFKEIDELIKEFITKITSDDISLKLEEDKIMVTYQDIISKVTKIDTTLKGAVEAEMQKAINSFKLIESKLIKAEKQKQEINLNQLKKVKEKFFPTGNLQERHDNFIPFYLKSGKNLITDLKETFNPFEFKMYLLE